MADKVLFPGDTLGIIGDSPNGVMLVEAAKRMGFEVIVCGSNEASPTMRAADVKIVGTSKEKLHDFAERCDMVTYESQYVPSDVIEYISRFTTVPQGKDTLEIYQDRLLERAFFEQINVNIAPYATIVSLDDVYQSVSSIGFPCILKPIQKVYRNKREMIIRRQTDIAKSADIIDLGTYVLESLISFDKELSITFTRDYEGKLSFFPVTEEIYNGQKLNRVLTPARINNDVEKEVKNLAKKIADNTNYVGAMQVSFFLTESGALYVKRMVPAISEAGYVFDKATLVSIFEQHLRVLARMPLASTEMIEPTAMVLVNDDDMNDLRTQWVLKDNWYYNFFRYPETMKPRPAGYVLVTAPTIDAAEDQIESTGIWTDSSADQDNE